MGIFLTSLLVPGRPIGGPESVLIDPRLKIFDSSVWRGIPSLAAAPDGPEIQSQLCANAPSINSFSRSASVADSGTAGLAAGASRFGHVSFATRDKPSLDYLPGA